MIERAAADVEAHISARKPATIAAVAAVLGTFAFAQQASASVQPAKAQVEVSRSTVSTQVHPHRRPDQQAGAREDADQQACVSKGSDRERASDLARRPAAGRRRSAGSARSCTEGSQDSPGQRLREVVPELLWILESDREPEEPCGHTFSFPATELRCVT